MVEGVCSSAVKDVTAPDDIAAGISVINNHEGDEDVEDDEYGVDDDSEAL